MVDEPVVVTARVPHLDRPVEAGWSLFPDLEG
jgi:hypothetical protein